jgi:hypothetical protein
MQATMRDYDEGALARLGLWGCAVAADTRDVTPRARHAWIKTRVERLASMSLTSILVYNQPPTNLSTEDSFEKRKTCQNYGQIGDRVWC